MNRKRLISLLLALLMVCGLTSGCGILFGGRDSGADMVPFDEMEYARPDLDAALAKADALIARLQSEKPKTRGVREALEDCFADFQHLRTMEALATIRSDTDVTDTFYRAELDYCSDAVITYRAKLDELFSACAASPIRQTLDIYFGKGFLDDYEGEYVYPEEMIRLEKQENELVNRYYAELAASRFSWNGQDYTLDELYQADRDGTLEGIDFGEALTQFYTDVNRTLGGIFVQLVQVRQALAAEAGYDNYLDMAYDDNYRDYDPGQAAEFTQAVRLELVPLYRQAKEIGLTEDAFMGTPEMDPDDALMLVTGIADAMGDDIDETAEFLLEYDLINVDRSDVKASDSYEIYLPDYESPYVFANTIGYAEDILTIAHELGHAVDDYVHYEANDSTDVSETLSQAMEYLCLPYLEDDVRETVTAYKLMDTLSMYAEQGCYNAFEEEVYALAPEDVTLEKINAIALRSAEAFGTTSEWGAAYDSMSWVDITHFFQQPMYIISYIVSDSMAIQFYEQELAKEGRGLELYKKAMGLAGEKAFTELAPALDLRDPLSAAQVHAIANLLRTQLFK